MWQVERRLESGGIGDVSVAKTPAGERVALKVLRSSPNLLTSDFEKEILLLAKLRHTHIVSILGCRAQSLEILGSEQGPCYWMEYVEGTNVLDAARGAKAETIFGWFVQGLEALHYLNAQGVLHGDLSPRNLLIDKQGRLKLLDFGLASLLGESAGIETATLPYLAPERMGGVHVPASDLFSLGTIFYEALAGRHPRGSASGLHDLMKAMAPALLDAAPSLGTAHAVAARVIDGMIENDLSRRFARADEALAAFRGDGFAESSSPEYHSLVFWGAEPALEKVAAAIKGLGEKSAIVALHGITGVGKKRFLREFTFRCALANVPVFESRDGRFGEIRAGACVFRSLESLSLPELSGLLGVRRRGIPERGSLLVLEWNDDALSQAGRDFLSHVARWPEVIHVHLKNLECADALGLISGAFGPDVSAETAEELFRETGGNPLMLVQAIKLRRERKTKGLEESISWRETLLWRILSLEEPERNALCAIAVSYGSVATPQGLEAAFPGLSPRLHPLAEKDLLRREPDGSYGLSLPLLTELLKEVYPAPEWKSLHAGWLKSLRAAPPSPERLHHAIALKDEKEIIVCARPVADLLWASGKKTESLALVARCLDVMEASDDRVERSRLLKEKMNLLSDAGRLEEALEAAEAWFALGPDNDAMPLKTVKYWFTTGRDQETLGRDDEAAFRLRECLKAGDEGAPAQAPFLARAHSLLGISEFRRGKTVEAKEHLQKALALSGPKGRRRAETLRNLAVIYQAEKLWEDALHAIQDAQELYREDRFDQGVFSCFLQQGNLALARNETDAADAAEAAYAEAEKIALALDNDLLLADVWNNRGVLERLKGKLGPALDLLNRAREVFEILGKKNDLAETLKNLAVTEAAAGRFDRAKGILGAEDALREYRDGVLPPAEGEESAPPWNLEHRLRQLKRLRGDPKPIRKILSGIYEKLPPGLKIHFVERHDYKKFTDIKDIQPKETVMTTPQSYDWDSIHDRLNDLNRELLRESDMDIVLRRLMDSAMEIANAQNGFLLLQAEAPEEESPIPGFMVAVARNVKRESLKTYEYALSLSIIRQSMQAGDVVVTDNALQDPRFRDAKSVHLAQLKSVLALPVNGPQGILGVFYLDHPLKDGLFQGETIKALKMFSGLAAIALQKGRMIDALKKSNESLSGQVSEQAVQMERLEGEVKESRLRLKNEYGDIIGRSPKMMEALSLVDKVTDAKVPVWIYGESGTGKEAIARALHFNSARKAQPFVTENCSALPESLLESELFGHKKGAFTHATQDKKGILQYADKGTIFLDEIADMSLNLQAKLLRFLQEGEVRPLGSHQVVKVDVRVVSASNKDLPQLVREGKFREDLFFRLNGITVNLPPLRERMDDLPLLAKHFLGKKAKLSSEALRLLMAYPWPGNIRELQQTLETALLFEEKGEITRKSLQFKAALLSGAGEKGRLQPGEPVARTESPAKELSPDLEKILRAIRDQCFHKGKAAAVLGISRRHLYTKLEQYGVSPESGSLKAYIEKNLGA